MLKLVIYELILTKILTLKTIISKYLEIILKTIKRETSFKSTQKKEIKLITFLRRSFKNSPSIELLLQRTLRFH